MNVSRPWVGFIFLFAILGEGHLCTTEGVSMQLLMERFQMDVSTALVAATFRLRHFHSDKNRSDCRLWPVWVVWNHSPTKDEGGKNGHGREYQ